jgi:hypothetical protein
MQMSSTTAEKSVGSLVLNSVALQSASAVVELCVGHPFDLVKTRLQAEHGLRPARRLVTSVWRTEGLKGFYRGWTANAGRALVKASFRGPARPYFKLLYRDSVPTALVDVATGFSLAVCDALILTPLERIKVLFMTAPPDAKSYSFLTRYIHQNGILNALTRGMVPNFVRGSLSWSAYLTIECRIEEMLRDSELGELFRCVFTGLVGGVANLILVLPFDNCKTQFQKFDSLERRSAGSVVLVPVRIFQERGVSALYAGWSVRLPHYIIVAGVQARFITLTDQLWGLRL